MAQETPRKLTTAALAFGAMVFGMVLAGGIDLTPTTSAAPAPEPTDGKGVRVETVTQGGLPGFADLAAAVSPAVVLIQATKIETGSENPHEALEFFFGPRGRRPRTPQGEGEGEERRSDSSGSGFVVSGAGEIVTNYHVIEDASSLTVTVDGREYEAEVVGQDPATDIALLKIKPEAELAYLNLGDSDALRPGDWVMVIGSPLQLANSVSVGVVSAKARRINITQDSSLESFIQTDAAINFGNSGGPLVDLEGSVVGIATAINFGAENIGFAVPVATLKGILGQLREHGQVRRGYLGVNIEPITWPRAEFYGLESTDGALVTQVAPNGPSEDAGIEHGDIIIRVDDHYVETTRDLIDYVALLQPGADVEVRIFREGKRLTKRVELGERPDQSVQIAAVPEEEESEIDWMGIQYQDLTPGIRDRFNMPGNFVGVFVSAVSPTSPLFDENVRENDVIVEVSGRPVTDVESFEAIVESVESGSFLNLYMLRYNPRGGEPFGHFAFVRVP